MKNSINSLDPENLSPIQREALVERARRVRARRHFKHFSPFVYHGYKANWHSDLLCDALESVQRGEIRFLMVEMPPRHSKSVHVSQLFPAYVVGKDKDAPVIVTSYSEELATTHGRETRDIIQSPEYRLLFPGTTLAPDSTAKGRWNTTGRGAYTAAGIGGSVVGKGAQVFIVDDPFKDRKEVNSKLIRDQRWTWFRTMSTTRITPTGAVVLMHQRWHKDDIIGRLTEGEEKEEWVDYFDWLDGKRAKWVRLRLTAIAEEDEPYRLAGEALWPQQFSLQELEQKKATLGPYEWSAQYQQNPITSENQEFKDYWFKHIEEQEVVNKITSRFLTIDALLKNKDTSDYFGFCDNRVCTEGKWHLRAWRSRMDVKSLFDFLFTMHRKNNYDAIGIESTAYEYTIKPFLDEEMLRRGEFLPITELKHHQTNKEIRIRGLQPRYAAGSVFHVAGACKDLEEEAIEFPLGAHDDVLDATAYQDQISKRPFNRADTAAVKKKLSTNHAR